MSAAPTAKSPRAKINTPGLGEKAATSDATPNKTIPYWKTRLWPYRSPRVPVPKSSPVITNGYVLMIHSDSLVDAPRSTVNGGTAMYRIEVSSVASSSPSETAVSTSQRPSGRTAASAAAVLREVIRSWVPSPRAGRRHVMIAETAKKQPPPQHRSA